MNPSVLVVAPAELDLMTAPQLLAQLREGLTTRPQRLIVDLSKVRFLAAKGIQTLIVAREEAEQTGVGFELLGVHSNGLVCRMFTIAGVIQSFAMADQIADPLPRPPDEPRTHSNGVELVFQQQPQPRSDAARVTGGYCDEATGHLRWVAVRAPGCGAQEDEWLVPARHIVSDGDRFFVALPTDAIWGGPTLSGSGAPEEIDGDVEERLRRHYADTVRPTAMLEPAPTSSAPGRVYRISDIADALAQSMIRRRVVDCRSARFGASRIHDRPTDAD